MVTNRSDIENLIYKTFTALDPSGNNTTKYKEMFKTMDDKAFEMFFKKFLADKDENFGLDIVEFEHMLKFEYCEAAAKVVGVPLMEYVYLPHLTKDKNNIIKTKQKCLVGYINVKATQQLLHKKNGLSHDNEKRSQLNGQVTGDSKKARNSDVEATMLMAMGADKILSELHGPRSDDMLMKRQALKSIATKGYVSLEELESSSTNKVALSSLNTYMLSMGLKTDVISESYILPKMSQELFN